MPGAYRANFIHLYLDIAWFGILSGSAVNFLSVYLARLGASGLQIGLLGAMGALVSLGLAIPAGRWLERRPVDKAVFQTSIYYRLFYLLWIPLPWLFGEQGQIWALIAIALLMGIPLTVIGVGFNALFAAAVPAEWRAAVVGVRNVVLSMTFMLSSLGSGYLLDHVPFPAGYQIVFAIGAFGALMSSLHLYFIRVRPSAPLPRPAPDSGGAGLPPAAAPRRLGASLRLDIWKTPFAAVLLVMLGFHLAQFLAIPLFPLYFVNQMGLNDAQIGVGTALFYLSHLVASTQLARIARRLGNQKVTAVGVVGLSIYPILLAFSQTAYAYFALQFIAGAAWGLTGGAYANYLLERIPEGDRPAHLAWYTLVANACILVGSLAGPAIAGILGLGVALIVFGMLRLLAGLAIWRWG